MTDANVFFKRVLSISKFCITKYIFLQDLISKLRNCVVDHETYQENFNECAEWLGTLTQRLQVCAEMAGDKHDVEDRLSKLQVS